MSFGYALRKFRESRHLSLREFGKLCDIDHAYIHRLEREEKTAPSEQVVDAFVRALKLNLGTLASCAYWSGRRSTTPSSMCLSKTRIGHWTCLNLLTI